MIGQGRVLMSPLGMALVAAAVSSGQARTPSLMAGERGDDGRLAACVDGGRPARIMRLVVTEGTASSLRGLPGGVAAKTGTAEYGTSRPLRTHGWMIGYRGNLAFACLVVDGAGGNSDAGPVVRAFLERAPRYVVRFSQGACETGTSRACNAGGATVSPGWWRLGDRQARPSSGALPRAGQADERHHGAEHQQHGADDHARPCSRRPVAAGSS